MVCQEGEKAAPGVREWEQGVGQGGKVPGKAMPALPPACQNQHLAKEHHFASGLGLSLWPWRKTSSQVPRRDAGRCCTDGSSGCRVRIADVATWVLKKCC